MASKEDNRLCREDDGDDDTQEACHTGLSSHSTDSAISTDEQTPMSLSSRDKGMQHKPTMSASIEKDTQQKPLKLNLLANLGHGEEAHQKPFTSRQSAPLGHGEDKQTNSLRPGLSATTDHREETCQKLLESFACADETNPKTYLADSHSIIPNASDDYDDESLKKPKYNTHVMLPDRQNLERHAGTLIDIYNDIHSK